MIPRIKICCIKAPSEAALAIAQGASALGLVSAMPSGPGVISEERIAEIAAGIPPPVATFLLTCQTTFEAIADQQRRCRTNTIQICDEVSMQVLSRLRAELPGIKIVQVIHVTGEDAVEHALRVAGHVDALLLDSGNPSRAVKELGGTGRVHNWAISRAIRDAVPVPIFLAGGLNASNVAEAVDVVRPFGLDVCSGVRTSDILDPAKLVAFFDVVRSLSSRG